MFRYLTSAVVLVCLWVTEPVNARRIVLADLATRTPLPNAAIYDCNGELIGLSNQKGTIPAIAPDRYPLTVTYLGFYDKTIHDEKQDTVFLAEIKNELQDLFVDSRQVCFLHVLAYVREYSTMSTATDTVSLFREKMADYMLPAGGKSKFTGWTQPRVLTSKSYYRFTDANGLDSVSDVSRHHFSWSDWIGLAPRKAVPEKLQKTDSGVDSIFGRYSLAEAWSKSKDSIKVKINILADPMCRKWVPNMAGFFRKGLDFDKFKIEYDYLNIGGDTISEPCLTGFRFNILSNGRGHDMFMFNRVNEPYDVSTRAEIYILDKEYITLKEARRWEKQKFNTDEIGIFEPMLTSPLPAETMALIDRVNRVNKEEVRLNVDPDLKMISKYQGRNNYKIGKRVLGMLKDLTGISAVRQKIHLDRGWKTFRKQQVRRNLRQTAAADTVAECN